MPRSKNGGSEFDPIADQIYRALVWIRDKHGLNNPQIYLIASHVLETSIGPKIKADLEKLKAGKANGKGAR